MDSLYAKYGQLMVQLEILQGQIGEVKKKIAEELSKPKEEAK